MNMTMGRLIALIKKFGGGQGAGGTPVQPDWNQNDPEAADYVKNRTHGITSMTERGRLSFNPSEDYYLPGDAADVLGYGPIAEYATVIFNGIEHKLLPRTQYDGIDAFVAEDGSFCIGLDSDGWFIEWSNELTEDVVEVIGYDAEHKMLDNKYLQKVIREPVVFSNYNGKITCNYATDELAEVLARATSHQQDTTNKYPVPEIAYKYGKYNDFTSRCIAVAISSVWFITYSTSNNGMKYLKIDINLDTGAFTPTWYNVLPPILGKDTLASRPFFLNENGIAMWVDSFNPIIADSSGAKWKLIVGTDGTLSTEAVTE